MPLSPAMRYASFNSFALFDVKRVKKAKESPNCQIILQKLNDGRTMMAFNGAGEPERGAQCLTTLSSASSHLQTHTFQLFRNISQQNGEQTDDDANDDLDDLHHSFTFRLILCRSIGPGSHVQCFFGLTFIYGIIKRDIVHHHLTIRCVLSASVCTTGAGGFGDKLPLPEPPYCVRYTH